MPYKLEFEENGVYAEFFGLLDTSTIIELDSAMLSSPKFVRVDYFITDFLKVDEVCIDYYKLKSVSHFTLSLANWNYGLKHAIVARQEHIHLAEKHIDFLETRKISWKIKIFTELNNARNWIEDKSKKNKLRPLTLDSILNE